MKYTLLTAFIVSFGVSGISIASPVCEKLKIPANKLAAFRLHDVHGKVVRNRLNDAVTCLDANWSNLSQRLTFRGFKTQTASALPTESVAPMDAVRYSPAAMYSANIATPSAFLTRPVTHVNYLPGTSHLSNPLDTTQLHLMDEVPTSNYQGSLATPIVYQTGHWNVNRY